MRTTLNIDDEVLHAAREVARQQRVPTGAVVSRLLREALTGSAASTRKQVAQGKVAGFRPFTDRDRPVDNESINRLRDNAGV